MEDHDRMIAAARRKARRLARKTDITYQQALDRVARDEGRAHWSAFMADPAPVTRDEPPSPQRAFPTDWDTPMTARPPEMRGGFVLPAYNALGADALPKDAIRRRRHVETMAEILIPRSKGPTLYFNDAGREALCGFIGVEIVLAERERRVPSLPAMIDWINAGLRKASDRREKDRARVAARRPWVAEELVDEVGVWLDRVARAASDGDAAAASLLADLAVKGTRERDGVLGAMDKALLPFRNATVRAANV